MSSFLSDSRKSLEKRVKKQEGSLHLSGKNSEIRLL